MPGAPGATLGLVTLGPSLWVSLDQHNHQVRGEIRSRMKGLFACSNYTYKWLWIKYCNVRIGASVGTLYRFAIELAYSHNVLFRLFVGLMEINPVFLLISLCISLVLGILSFYYEYSYLI